MGKHFDRIVCPACLKRFDAPHKLKAHQKAKRHRVADLHTPEAERTRRELQTEHQRRMAEKHT